MNQTVMTVGMLIGGLGLFMLAVNMITDGLKLAAGHTLRDLLGKWTRSPGHGILAGISITAIVQSSSAVTVATIGFVNAGLLSMYQALGVVYGSNIGTTVTAWLVAIIGFKVKVEAFALPMIGLGMLLHLAGGEARRSHAGIALAGFGLFFIGVDVLREAFEGLADFIDLGKFAAEGVLDILAYVGIGFLMTVLTQSSSAAIAITLTAATGGLIGLNAAAAMVIGANVGTTSTAAIAVIGATSNAKRVAAAHVIFNLVTGIVALMILPLLFWLIKVTGEVLGLEDIPAVMLALFHTIFNILGVLLMWPLTSRMTSFLKKRFITQEEIEGSPRYLDKTVSVTPMLALNALALELSRLAVVVRRMSLTVLSAAGPGKSLKNDYIVVERLSHAIADFISWLEKGAMTSEAAEQLAPMIRAQQHLLLCAEEAGEITRFQSEQDVIEDQEVLEKLSRFRAKVVKLFETANTEAGEFSLSECELLLEDMQEAYDRVNEMLLQAGSELRIPVAVTLNVLEQNSHIRRMTRQMIKALRDLNEVYMVSELQHPELTEKDEETAAASAEE